MMALVGTFAHEFQVTLPLLARVNLHGGPGICGFLTAAMGVGAVAAGLAVAALGRTGLWPFTAAAAGFGAAIAAAAALVPSLPGELAALTARRLSSTAFMATGTTTLQLTADPQFRGRVMALWPVTFTGGTPIGGPIGRYSRRRSRPSLRARDRRPRLPRSHRARRPHPAAHAPRRTARPAALPGAGECCLDGRYHVSRAGYGSAAE